MSTNARQVQRQVHRQPIPDFMSIGGRQGVWLDNGQLRMKFLESDGRAIMFGVLIREHDVRLVSPTLEVFLHAHLITLGDVRPDIQGYDRDKIIGRIGCLVLCGVHHTMRPFLNIPWLKATLGLLPKR